MSNSPCGCLIQINTACNLKCRHCSQSAPYSSGLNKNDNTLSIEAWFDILSNLKSIGMPRVEFTGGEPFMRSDFSEILIKAKELSFDTSIVTNGLLLNENISWLERNKPDKLRISCYGGTKESYEFSTGVKGSFEILINNIKLVLSKGIEVTIVFLINNQNHLELKNLVEYFYHFKIKKYRFIQLMDVGRSNGTSKETINLHLGQSALIETLDILAMLNRKYIDLRYKISLKSGDEDIFRKYNYSFDTSECKVDLNYLWTINEAGHVYSCCLLMYENIGKIFNAIIDDLSNWKEWGKEEIYNHIGANKCDFCPAKSPICPEGKLCPLIYAEPRKWN